MKYSLIFVPAHIPFGALFLSVQFKTKAEYSSGAFVPDNSPFRS